MIAQMKQGSSFLELPVMAEIQKHHTKFLKLYPNQRGFHAMVNLLLQATQDPGMKKAGGAAKIIGVIDELIESIHHVMK